LFRNQMLGISKPSIDYNIVVKLPQCWMWLTQPVLVLCITEAFNLHNISRHQLSKLLILPTLPQQWLDPIHKKAWAICPLARVSLMQRQNSRHTAHITSPCFA